MIPRWTQVHTCRLRTGRRADGTSARGEESRFLFILGLPEVLHLLDPYAHRLFCANPCDQMAAIMMVRRFQRLAGRLCGHSHCRNALCNTELSLSQSAILRSVLLSSKDILRRVFLKETSSRHESSSKQCHRCPRFTSSITHVRSKFYTLCK